MLQPALRRSLRLAESISTQSNHAYLEQSQLDDEDEEDGEAIPMYKEMSQVDLTRMSVQFAHEKAILLFRHGCNGDGKLCKACIGALNHCVEKEFNFRETMSTFHANHKSKHARAMLDQLYGHPVSLGGLSQEERWKEYERYGFSLLLSSFEYLHYMSANFCLFTPGAKFS
jgi:hypothetical protein